MRKAIALILVLAMALTFCACGKDTTAQSPAAPAATPTPEEVTTSAPTDEPAATPEAPAEEPEATPAPEASTTPETVANTREESYTNSGTFMINEYDGTTGELLLTEFYSDDGSYIESIMYYENNESVLQVDYRPDGQIDCEYHLENDEVTYIVLYNYDADGNFIDTTTEDMSWQGGDEGFNDVETYYYDDGSYMLVETNEYGETAYTAYYDAEGKLTTEQIFENGMPTFENHFENGELVSYNQHIYAGYDKVWSGFYSRTDSGDFVLDYEKYYGEQPPVEEPVVEQPTGGSQSSTSQSVALPELSDYEYMNMSVSEVEEAFAANGFTVSKQTQEYDFTDYVGVSVFGDGPSYRRAMVNMDPNGEVLPWIYFEHKAEDSSAPMDIGLRGIKTHDSLLTVLQKLGIRDAETTADTLNALDAQDDSANWYENLPSDYEEDGKYVSFGVSYNGERQDIGVYIGYSDILINFYFADGILVGFETM